MMRQTYTCSVLVPTWKRPALLRACLTSLCAQSYSPHQVIAVYRAEDREGLGVIEEFKARLPLTILLAEVPGVIHAENLAIQAATGDILCFIDDDAEAPPDWLRQIVRQYESDPELAGVGGPDFITGMPADYRRVVPCVGHLTWYGRTIGNHHQLTAAPSAVMMLKGVNMSFRRSWIRPLDIALSSEHAKGNGSFWEMDLCLDIIGRGGRLTFDPALDVRHHSNHSHFIVLDNLKNSSHNMVYVLLKHLSPLRKIIFLIYAFLIGNRQLRGVVWSLVHVFKSGPGVMREACYSWWGMALGIATYCRQQKRGGPAMWTSRKKTI